MSEINKKKILNLAGELPESVATFFEQDTFQLIERGSLDDPSSLDFIFVLNFAQARDVADDFLTVKNDIEIISLGNIKEIKEFLLLNGRLVLDKSLQQSDLLYFVLEQFFLKKHNIHLSSAYHGYFEETQQFAITDHLATGRSFDLLSLYAFDRDFSFIPIRSYLDHAIYYLTYLKQAELSQFPFEVEFGAKEDLFAINIQANVKNFVAEYLLDGFGDINPADPLSYLLGVMRRSCDYLDIIYLEETNKIVLNGFWNKDQKNKLVSGIGFHHIMTTEQVFKQVERQIEEYKPEQDIQAQKEQQIQELKNKKLPGGLGELQTNLDQNSVLKDQPEQLGQTVKELSQIAAEEFPDTSIADFGVEEFDQVLEKYPDQELAKKLNQKDKEHLHERMQKKEVLAAMEMDTNTIHGQGSEQDPEEIASDSVSEELTEELMKNVNADVFESLMQPQTVSGLPEDKDEFSQTVSGLPEDNNNFSQTVSGLPEDKDDFSQTVSGMPEDKDNFSQTVSGLPEDKDNFSQTVSGMPEDKDNFSQTVSGSAEDEKYEQFVSNGLAEDEDAAQFLSDIGIEDEAEQMLVFGADDEHEEFVTVVEGGEENAEDFAAYFEGDDEHFEEDVFNLGKEVFEHDPNQKFVIPGDPVETEKNMKLIVSNNLEKNNKLNKLKPAVKAFIKENAPSQLSDAFARYAQGLGKKAEELTPEEIHRFHKDEVPKVINSLSHNKEKVAEFANQISQAPELKRSEIAKDKRIVKAHMEQVEDSAFKRKDHVVKADKKDPENETFVIEADEKKIQEKNDFEAQFKAQFQAKMLEMQKKMASLQQEANQAKSEAQKLKQQQPAQQDVQKVLQETMKDSFKKALKDSAQLSPEQKAAKENEVVKGLSKSLQIPEEQVKNVVKDLSSKKEEKEKQVIKDNEEKKKISEEVEKVAGGQPNGAANKALIAKLKQVEVENKRLKDGIAALKLKQAADKDVSTKVSAIKEQAKVNDKDLEEKSPQKEVSLKVPEAPSDVSENEKQEIMSKMAAGKELTPEEKEKVAKVFDASQNQIAEFKKQAERELKKAMLEAEQQETLFKGELDKATKMIKAKDLVLDKAKETMKSAIAKKDEEINGLKGQINTLNQKSSSDKLAALEADFKTVKKDNESLVKMSEVYKAKIEDLTKKAQAAKNNDDSALIADENRNLQRVKTSLEKKLQEKNLKLQKLEAERQENVDTDTKAKNIIHQLKSDKIKAEGLVKTLKDQQKSMMEKMQKLEKANDSSQAREAEQHKQITNKLHEKIKVLEKKLDQAKEEVSTIDNSEIEKAVAKKYESKIKSSLKELDMAKNQNKQLQAKIKELTDRLKGGGAASKDGKSGNAGTPKEKRLEANVKKLNSELSKAKNEAVEQKKEVMKVKKEATALKNQLAALKRELDKSKKAA